VRISNFDARNPSNLRISKRRNYRGLFSGCMSVDPGFFAVPLFVTVFAR